GREVDDNEARATEPEPSGLSPEHAWIRALGGAANLRSVEACTTRLRLVVGDAAHIDDKALSQLGARGVLRLAEGAVQVVIGPIADQLASEIRAALRDPLRHHADAASRPAIGVARALPSSVLPARALAALGGRDNLAEVQLRDSRLCVS